jgi:outer membrane lipoprotein SlyB
MRFNGETEPIVAGSNRAKKIGAIVGGAAVGGVLGHVVGGSKGTVIGGLRGGAAGYGATRHALRTMQLKPGTVVTFTAREDVVARRF